MKKESWQFELSDSILGVMVTRIRRVGKRDWIDDPDKFPENVKLYFSLSDSSRKHLINEESIKSVLDIHDNDTGIKWSVSPFRGVVQLDPISKLAVLDSVHVDLKWSLWSADDYEWAKRADGVWSRMEAAFDGKYPGIIVYTAPRKEIRQGSVTIRKGEATVDFKAIWDAPYCHIPESIGENHPKYEESRERIIDHFANGYGFADDQDDPIGATIYRDIKARKFENLMKRIDGCESDLIKREAIESKNFDEFIKELEQELTRG